MPCLKFCIRGNVDRFMKNALPGRDFYGILSKISYSYTAPSRVNMQTQLSMWITTRGLQMMSNCICYDKMHDFLKMLENRGSEGQNSFSAHPTLSRKAPPGEFVVATMSSLMNQKYDQHINSHFGIQYEYVTAILRS